MGVQVCRICPQPYIADPGLGVSEFDLDLPTLDRLESTLGRTKVGPTLYGCMSDGIASFGVREKFRIDYSDCEEDKVYASVNYNSERVKERGVTLDELPPESFDGNRQVNQKGIENMLTPLKEIVSVNVEIHKDRSRTEYVLVYSYSEGNGTPFFIYVGCRNGEDQNYPLTLQTIAPGYSGLLSASSVQELKQRDMSLKEFLQEFVDKLIPGVKQRLPQFLG